MRNMKKFVALGMVATMVATGCGTAEKASAVAGVTEAITPVVNNSEVDALETKASVQTEDQMSELDANDLDMETEPSSDYVPEEEEVEEEVEEEFDVDDEDEEVDVEVDEDIDDASDEQDEEDVEEIIPESGVPDKSIKSIDLGEVDTTEYEEEDDEEDDEAEYYAEYQDDGTWLITCPGKDDVVLSSIYGINDDGSAWVLNHHLVVETVDAEWLSEGWYFHQTEDWDGFYEIVFDVTYDEETSDCGWTTTTDENGNLVSTFGDTNDNHYYNTTLDYSYETDENGRTVVTFWSVEDQDWHSCDTFGEEGVNWDISFDQSTGTVTFIEYIGE